MGSGSLSRDALSLALSVSVVASCDWEPDPVSRASAPINSSCNPSTPTPPATNPAACAAASDVDPATPQTTPSPKLLSACL